MTTQKQAGSFFLAKRALDVVVSLALLVVLAPLLLVIAALIRLDSSGPALYRGIRLGRERRAFAVLKFRTMQYNADDAPHREYVRSLLVEGRESSSQLMYKLVDDPRVTRVGHVLRRWSLDEFPQLLNVIRGEMSLVGPRPEVPYALDLYEPWHYRRFDVLPGMTGLWQVNGRAKLTPREMLALDCRYADEWSLWIDVRILARTIPAVLRRVGSA